MLAAARGFFKSGGNGIALSSHAYDDTVTGANCSVQFRLNSSGAAEYFTTTSGVWTAIPGEWLVIGSAGDYQSVVTVTSGSLTSGPTAASVLSTTRTWVCTQSGSPGNKIVVFTLEIQRVSDSAVMDSATITLDATRD